MEYYSLLMSKLSRNELLGPGQVAQLIRALSWYAKDASLIPGQGTYENQAMNV